MTKNDHLVEQLNSRLGGLISQSNLAFDEVTIECQAQNLKALMLELRDAKQFGFDQLIDICAVDYLTYGEYDWETESATEKGFSRGVEPQEERAYVLNKPRFAVVYHLLSTTKNHRLRVKLFIEEAHL